MMRVSELTSCIPALFAEVMDQMSSDELLLLAAAPKIDFDVLLWRISSTSNPMHRRFHIEAIARVLVKDVNLHYFRYTGLMMRAYSRDQMREIRRLPPFDIRNDKALWLIRMIEEARHERLIDEAGEVLP